MGIVYSYALQLFSRDEVVLDEKIGLTNKQKKMAQDFWRAALMKNPDLGVTSLIRMFEKKPDYQKFFTAFEGLPLEDLPKNVKFRAHCRGIISALSSAIDLLDDFDLMSEILVAVGERHARRSRDRQPFYELKAAMMEVMKETMGDDFTDEVTNILAKLLDVLFTQILQVLDMTTPKDI